MAMEFPFTLIGFGEAGSTFACAGEWCGRAMGWDILAERRAAMPDCGVEPLMTSGTIARQRAAGKRGAEARKEKAA
jgi:hypothetical protein